MTQTLYQDAIIAHARAPHGLGALSPCDSRHSVINRLCGDEVEVFVRQTENGHLQLGFTAKACALCRASGSILMTLADGRTRADAMALVDAFMPRFSDLSLPDDAPAVPPGTEALYSIRAFPSRSQCVLLPWQALAGALAQLKSE